MSYTITLAKYNEMKTNAGIVFCQLNDNMFSDTVDTVVNVGDEIKIFVGSSTGKEFYVTTTPTTSSTYFKSSSEYLPFTLEDIPAAGGGTKKTLATVTYREPTNGTWDDLVVNTRLSASKLPIYTVTAADVASWQDAKFQLTYNDMSIVAGTKFYEDGVLKATAYALQQFYIENNNPTIYLLNNVTAGGTVNHYFSLNSDMTIATINIPIMGNLESISKIIGKTRVAPRALYTLTDADIKEFTDTGVNFTINTVAAAVGSKLYEGDSLLATAQAGREFYVDDTSNLASVYLHTRESGSDKNRYFTISDDKLTASLIIPALGITEVIRNIVTTTRQATPKIVGTNNVYTVTESEFNKLNKERFVTVNALNNTVYDYGQFILSLLLVPFEIPAEYILLPEPITLANFKGTAVGTKLNSDIIELDMGSVSVPNTNNNLLDYLNTTALLYLPRVPPINIDLEYVIGQTISIKYLLDCYTGKATINISSTKTNSVITTTQVDLGVSIPYASYGTKSLGVSNSNIDVGGNNEITVPRIDIISNDSILKDGVFTIPIIDESVLNTQSGFIKIEEIELNSSALGSEINDIISILSRGVIIK